MKKKLKWEIPELVALNKAANGASLYCEDGSSDEVSCLGGASGPPAQ